MGTDPIALHCDPKVTFWIPDTFSKLSFPHLLVLKGCPVLVWGSWQHKGNVSALEGWWKSYFWLQMTSNYAPTLLPGKIALEHGCAVNGWLAGPQVLLHLKSFIFVLHLIVGAADREWSNEPVRGGGRGGREAGAGHTSNNLRPHPSWGLSF